MYNYATIDAIKCRKEFEIINRKYKRKDNFSNSILIRVICKHFCCTFLLAFNLNGSSYNVFHCVDVIEIDF